MRSFTVFTVYYLGFLFKKDRCLGPVVRIVGVRNSYNDLENVR
jgi:hypothetical protein